MTGFIGGFAIGFAITLTAGMLLRMRRRHHG